MRRADREIRRPRLGTAALLCVAALALTTLLRLLAGTLAIGGVWRVAWDAGATLLCFLAPAALGLFVLDGDQSALVRRASLRPAHIRLSALAGLLAVCPASLLTDALSALGEALWPASAAAELAAPPARLFLPALLAGALLAPVSEELFFRGYVTGLACPPGAERDAKARARAIAASALIFALFHGVDVAFPARALLGAFFALLALRMDSVLAPMLAHAAYNAALLLAAFAGLGGLFSGLTPLSCALRLAGCALFAWTVRRALALRPSRREASFQDARELSGRDVALLCTALLALVASQAALALMGAGR